MNSSTIQIYLVRSSIVFVWLVIFGGMLLIPRVVMYLMPSKHIAILTMPNMLNADKLTQFTKQTGISVSISYAENADEIMMKIDATQGQGYDLIMAADYQIPLLIHDRTIQLLDHEKLNFFKDIYPALCDHPFDPENKYSIPYYWGVYGFGIDTDYYHDTHSFSWDILFDATLQPDIMGMRDDIRELIFVAAQYLFGSADDLQDAEYEAITALLIAQKQRVIMYADERIDSLLISHTAPLIFTISGDLSRAMDVYNYIDFVIPDEGSFVDIDSFVIAADAQAEYAYQFLNYLYSVPVISYYAKLFRLSPPLSTADTYAKIPLLAYPTQELFSRLKFFDTVIPQSRIDAMLVALKSA